MKESIYIQQFTTPIGAMIGVASQVGIRRLEFVDQPLNEYMKSSECQVQNYVIADQVNEHLDLLHLELNKYFDGRLKQFTVPLELQGTDFQRSVWNSLCKIPYGETRSYQEQSIMVGDIKAIRAVAAANGSNKIAIVVPCHRVMGKSGKLTGYAGGIERKRSLLQHELAFAGPNKNELTLF